MPLLRHCLPRCCPPRHDFLAFSLSFFADAITADYAALIVSRLLFHYHCRMMLRWRLRCRHAVEMSAAAASTAAAACRSSSLDTARYADADESPSRVYDATPHMRCLLQLRYYLAPDGYATLSLTRLREIYAQRFSLRLLPMPHTLFF